MGTEEGDLLFLRTVAGESGSLRGTDGNADGQGTHVRDGTGVASSTMVLSAVASVVSEVKGPREKAFSAIHGVFSYTPPIVERKVGSPAWHRASARTIAETVSSVVSEIAYATCWLPLPLHARAPPAFSLDPGYARGTHRHASCGVAGYTPYSYREW